MRKGLTIAALALFAGLGVHGTDAHAAKKRSACDMPGTKTLKKQAGSRVFTKRGRSSLNGPYTRTFACRYKSGTVYRLGLEYDDDLNSGPVTLIRLSGRYVGWAKSNSDEFTDYSDVHVLDLSTGRRADPEVTDADTEGGWSVEDTALTPKGSFAWIVDVTKEAGFPGVTQVRTLVDGKVTTIDSAPGDAIRGTSLLLEGNQLSWTNADATKTATLP
jgi:hypothetical protein